MTDTEGSPHPVRYRPESISEIEWLMFRCSSVRGLDSIDHVVASDIEDYEARN